MTHREHLAIVLVQRDNGRLVKNDAFSLGVDQRVGRTQIDRKVACQG